MRTCPECGRSMEHRRSDARVCSTKCRVRAHRRDRAFPEAMASRRRWVRRTAEKRPITVNGWPASVTAPDDWSMLSEARASSAGAGMGYVLGDGIGCYDLDHCLHDGVLEPWARDVLDSVADPLLVEVSQSGEGLHIFLRTDAPHGRVWHIGEHRVEFYPDGRYIAVTGDVFDPWA